MTKTAKLQVPEKTGRLILFFRTKKTEDVLVRDENILCWIPTRFKHNSQDYYLLDTILNASNRTPKLVNKLCNTVLLVANSQGKIRVELESAEKAISDIQLG